MTFTQIIEDTEKEIAGVYLPNGIKYIDDVHNNAWTNAIIRFQEALEKKNLEHAREEAKVYAYTIKNLISAYRREQRTRSAQEFLDHI